MATAPLSKDAILNISKVSAAAVGRWKASKPYQAGNPELPIYFVLDPQCKYDCINRIRGSSGLASVTIVLPILSLDKTDLVFFERITPFIGSVLAHELTHVKQGKSADEERTYQMAWQASVASRLAPPTNVEWIHGYYDRWVELEAHGAQIAYEMVKQSHLTVDASLTWQRVFERIKTEADDKSTLATVARYKQRLEAEVHRNLAAWR